MIEYTARRDPKRPPMHPGVLLRDDVLPALGKDKTEIAKLLASPVRRCGTLLTRSGR